MLTDNLQKIAVLIRNGKLAPTDKPFVKTSIKGKCLWCIATAAYVAVNGVIPAPWYEIADLIEIELFIHDVQYTVEIWCEEYFRMSKVEFEHLIAGFDNDGGQWDTNSDFYKLGQELRTEFIK